MRISDWSSDVCSSDLNQSLSAALSGVITTAGFAPADHCSEAVGRILDRRVDAVEVLLVDAIRRHDVERVAERRSEEHTSELKSLMRISYAVFCLKKKTKNHHTL